MSKSRKENIEWFSDAFKALAHPHRLRIFLRMAHQCRPGTIETDAELGAAVREVAAGLEIAPSTVSHHMKELRRAGLIRMRRVGRLTECWVEPAVLERLARFFPVPGRSDVRCE